MSRRLPQAAPAGTWSKQGLNAGVPSPETHRAVLRSAEAWSGPPALLSVVVWPGAGAQTPVSTGHVVSY